MEPETLSHVAKRWLSTAQSTGGATCAVDKPGRTASTHLGDVDRVAFVVEQISVDPAVDGTTIKGHDILCQRSCLVREDVLNLTELLIQSGRPSLRRGVSRSIVHLVIPVDPPAVTEPDHLHAGTRTRVCRMNELMEWMYK